jgi:hypothetical protein
MLRIIFFLLCGITLMGSCKRDDGPDQATLNRERLQGKYRIVSSISSEAVDINLDGTAGNNMLSEITDLEGTDLVILIRDKFFLMHNWSEQYFGYGAPPAGYDSSFLVHYVRQALSRTFSVDAGGKTIHVHKDTEPTPDPLGLRFTFPEAVSIEGENTITIVFTKKLYTSAGWKTTTITTIYERYTKLT